MRYFHAESGFSLTEVMTAVVVFSLSLAGFSSMQITAIKLNARAYVTTQMTMVAQEQMEVICPFIMSPVDMLGLSHIDWRYDET